MNRKLLALAVTAALAAPLAAQAAPTVYGQLNMSVDLVDWDDGTNDGQDFEVNSNTSRLGVKGEEALTNGYSAVYKIEFGVQGDVASGVSGRDRYLGLKSNWGTVKLGAYDSPLRTSQGMVDQFNDMTYTDMGNFVTGENRLNNVIGYESPKIADVLNVNVAVQSGEDTAVGEDDDGISVSVVFDSNGLYLAAAMDNDIVDGLISDTVQALFNAIPLPYPGDEPFARDAVRLTAGYTMDALQFGAMIQTSEFANENNTGFSMDEESILLSAAYTMGKNVLKGQYVMANYDLGAGAEIDSSALIVGMDHNFTQTTKVFAQLGLSTTEVTGANDLDANVLTVGMQTKF
ncbi:MAG: porin [Moraxellaceae bacterium]